jgi:UDP-N-acetylmuramyl tripeptide synthase
LIADRWRESINELSSKTHLLLNADDPEMAHLGTDTKATVRYFGLKDSDVTSDHAADSVHCPVCQSRLEYKKIYYSHLGDWHCNNCKFSRPSHDISSFTQYPLAGIYNRYNTHAAVLTTRLFQVDEKIIDTAFKEFTPAFGRQEVLHKDGRKIQIFLSKNPTSFNQSLRTINELKGKNLLIVLNDGIADGRDISWIWDTEIESYTEEMKHITLSGTRCFDMGLRFKYAEKKTEFRLIEDLTKATELAIAETSKDETLYILPTYTAMLDIRKLLTGKKIL